MARRVELSKDRDTGQIFSDSFLFFKQQFKPFMNCLFILSAPCFIINKISQVYSSEHILNKSINLFSIPEMVFSLSQIIFYIGIWLMINISAAYMVCYSKGIRKAKPKDILHLVSDHKKKWWIANCLVLLLFILTWFIYGFVFTHLSPVMLIILIIVAFIILSHFIYRIDGLLILGLRENEDLVSDHRKVGETITGNRHYIWLCLAIAGSLSWLLHNYNYLPIMLIGNIGQYTELYNLQEWFNNHVALAVMISVIYFIFILYLSSFALIVLHILFFTLEEKRKGNSLIHKIEAIGKGS